MWLLLACETRVIDRGLLVLPSGRTLEVRVHAPWAPIEGPCPTEILAGTTVVWRGDLDEDLCFADEVTLVSEVGDRVQVSVLLAPKTPTAVSLTLPP